MPDVVLIPKKKITGNLVNFAFPEDQRMKIKKQKKSKKQKTKQKTTTTTRTTKTINKKPCKKQKKQINEKRDKYLDFARELKNFLDFGSV